MGKNRGKLKQKTSSVFKVAGHKALKAKGKAKRVKTNLKKINYRNKELTEKLNSQFASIQRVVLQKNTSTKKQNGEPSVGTLSKKDDTPPPVDIDSTVSQLEKLGQ